MSVILGINAYHGDSSAALVADGQLVAAVEEERFNRVKHWAGLPLQSIKFCLDAGGSTIGDIDVIAISTDPRANLARKTLFSIRNRPELASVFEKFKRVKKSLSIKERIAEFFCVGPEAMRARVVRVEHHLAHAACAFFTSPFDEAAILSIDGMGDFVSTLFARGEGNKLVSTKKIFYPHSVGFLYESVTRFLGFAKYGDEYKVMGLAPYGKPDLADAFRRMIRPTKAGFELDLNYFTHHKKIIKVNWDDSEPGIESFVSREFSKVLGEPYPARSPADGRMEDTAASLQAVTEEVVFHLINQLHHKNPCENLCLSGGVAMNSVVNGKAYLKTPFKRIFVPAGAADNGTSVGAAFYVWNQLMENPRSFQLRHAFWGPEFPETECRATAERHGTPYCRLEEGPLIERVAGLLCAGRVVGWFQGRMEFGARALGNRTLLADPRRADMRDIINTRIKFREKFRPFAPSVLEHGVSDYFEYTVPSPFMEKVVPIKKEKRDALPAVTHVDGTGRLQTVDERDNPLYWKLISEFERRTGVPMVLNTSLNENEPIVRTPEEAVQCFLRTRMDAIVLGPYLVERGGAE